MTVVVKAPENLVSDPPLTVSIVDKSGNLTRPWAIWFRDIYKRTSYKGGNAIDANIDSLEELVVQVNKNIDDIQANADNIEENSENIALNTESIIQNALAISQNAVNISNNASAILLVSSLLDDHVNAFTAHGSNGEIVGFDDTATELLSGLVKRMANISDAIQSSVNITTADIGEAPATYDQTYTQSVTDLTNENKAAINQLATDFNAAVVVLNELLAESQTSNQMSTP